MEGHQDYQELMEKARGARAFAYAPYSNFAVGAALQAGDGRVFLGCNIENASYSAGICAERVALYKAVSQGCRDFQAIAIYGETGFISPCGECRQVLQEFSRDIQVVMKKGEGYLVKALGELLPLGFKLLK